MLPLRSLTWCGRLLLSWMMAETYLQQDEKVPSRANPILGGSTGTSLEHDERSWSCHPHPRDNSLLPGEGSCSAGTGGSLGFAWLPQAPTRHAGPRPVSCRSSPKPPSASSELNHF